MDIDVTIIAHFVILLCTLWICSHLLMKPFMRTIARREERIEGVRGQAEALTEQTLEIERSLEAQLDEERQRCDLQQQQQLTAYADELQETLAEARENETRRLASALAEIDTQKEQLERELQPQVAQLSREVADKLLSRP